MISSLRPNYKPTKHLYSRVCFRSLASFHFRVFGGCRSSGKPWPPRQARAVWKAALLRHVLLPSHHSSSGSGPLRLRGGGSFQSTALSAMCLFHNQLSSSLSCSGTAILWGSLPKSLHESLEVLFFYRWTARIGRCVCSRTRETSVFF